MTQAEQVLLSLIRKSLFDSKESFPSDTDWDAVLREAKQQTVVGIAAKALPDSCAGEAREKWKAAEFQQLANTILYWKAQDELHRLLTESGIPFVILKGAAAAMYYPDPYRRAMGDIDFLVPPEQFDRTATVLLENGYLPDHEPTDRHIGFSKNKVSFELHHHFSYLDLDIEDALLSGISLAERISIDNHVFSALPANENGLVLLAHLWEHLHSGVGMRQVIDWMMFVLAHLSNEYWNITFSKLARDYGLEKLTITATQMCHKYFGLPYSCSWFADADEMLCDDLFSQILRSGNFGRKPNMNVADSKTISALSGIHRYGLFRQLQQRGEANWKAYHKHPCLKPFAWLYQLVRYTILWVISPKKQKLPSLMQRENEINDLLKRLK